MPVRTVDVVVVGAGISGLEAARILISKGHSVALVAPSEIPASWAAGGMLVPFAEHIPDEDVLLYSRDVMKNWPAWTEAFAEDTGADAGFRPYGVFIPVKPEFGPLYQMTEFRLQNLNEPWHNTAWQGWGAMVPDGMLLPGGASVHNSVIWHALEKLMEPVRIRSTVIAINETPSTVTLELADGKTLQAGKVLLVPGWNATLVHDLPERERPFADRGAILRVLPPVAVEQEPVFFDIDMSAPLYMVPRNDGGLLIGATSAPQDEDLGWRDEDQVLLLERAAKYLPWLNSSHITHRWTGLRPKSVTGYPWLGYVGESRNVVALTGMHRNGVLWGPDLAGRAVDLLYGQKIELPASFGRSL